MNTWLIYGNVFVDAGGGNGVISTGDVCCVLHNVTMYNNTFVSTSSSIISMQCEPSGAAVCRQATGNIFKNNLLYAGNTLLVANGGGAYDNNYNTYWNSLDTPPTEINGQIVTGGPCPLSNCAIDSTGNYLPLQDGGTAPGQVNVGLTLPSPFDTDPRGHTRGADGTWERGAFEFGGRPSPPVNLRIIP